MLENTKATPSYRSWKAKPYTLSMATRMAQARASMHQPPLMSLHGKTGPTEHGHSQTRR